jgi:CheY-like chemotaxis protein
VKADANQLQQLISNLLTNGVEAVGSGPGRVHLSLKVVALDESSARAFDVQHPASAEYVQIEVRDDGVGMDRETLRRAFEPFFSTKFVGRGLGLSAAQGIARAHGGGIVAESQAGQGTIITVTLPCFAEAAAAAPVAVARATPPARAQTEAGVLFVDDEPSLREISKLALSDAGYNVWLAKNGLDALEIVRAHGEGIDVIVLDMTMPVMGGAEAARQLHLEQVTIPIIASSGYSEVETLERFGGVAPLFLPKPYRPDDLLAKVALALERASEESSVNGTQNDRLRATP